MYATNLLVIIVSLWRIVKRRLTKSIKLFYMDIFTKRFNEVLKFEQTNQAHLANQIGIARQCITDYKSGKSFPTIQTLARICTALDTSSDYLLGLTSDDGAELYSAPTANAMHETLSPDERELVERYRVLDDKLKKIVMDGIKVYGGANELVSKSGKKV